MKRTLLPHLICPVCLPKEYPLRLSITKELDDEIETGLLTCPSCKQGFPVQDGIANLVSNPDSATSGGQWRYEEQEMTARYLWSQYGDLLGEQTAEAKENDWAGLLMQNGAAAFEAGCAVGRLTFEMANRFGFSVGCDLSSSFIKTARRLARNRRLSFSLPLEGKLTESFNLQLPASWQTGNAEFIVADALRLPFAATSFDQVVSLNLLDRVSYPLAHLYEMNRVAGNQNSSFLFADPFSWSTSAAPEERWLGGTSTGPYPGRGLDNVRALLEGKSKVLMPAWKITRSGSRAWRMRTHRNHYEVINSDYLMATR